MKVTTELDLVNFNFWSGATDNEFTHSELRDLEVVMEDIFHEGATETQINDLFWFEEETLCEWIGLDFSEYLER